MVERHEVHLRVFDVRHVENTGRWLRDAELRSQIDCLRAPDVAENERYWLASMADSTRANFAIEVGEGQHCGNCGLMRIDRARANAELWIYLGERRGEGIGTVALRRLLQVAFNDMKLHRVYLRVLATNTRALQFYPAFGFSLEGRWRDHACVDGHWVDAIAFGLLAHEYQPH